MEKERDGRVKKKGDEVDRVFAFVTHILLTLRALL